MNTKEIFDNMMTAGIDEGWIKPVDEPELYTFRDFYIPARMMDSITRYIDHGIKPGSFLTGVISNNLREAVSNADDENLRNIPAYLGYFYNEAPSPCWGSQELMDQWIQRSFARRENSDE